MYSKVLYAYFSDVCFAILNLLTDCDLHLLLIQCSVNDQWGDQELDGDMKCEKIPGRERCAYGREKWRKLITE
jgi:hypothetical protein